MDTDMKFGDYMVEEKNDGTKWLVKCSIHVGSFSFLLFTCELKPFADLLALLATILIRL